MSGVCVWLHGSTKVVVRARERLAGPLGSIELRCGREVFAKLDARRKLRAILTFHVDDGLLFGTKSDSICQRVKELISTQFDRNYWGVLNLHGVSYLGLRSKLAPEGV